MHTGRPTTPNSVKLVPHLRALLAAPRWRGLWVGIADLRAAIRAGACQDAKVLLATDPECLLSAVHQLVSRGDVKQRGGFYASVDLPYAVMFVGPTTPTPQAAKESPHGCACSSQPFQP